jgi:hypothetical protein
VGKRNREIIPATKNHKGTIIMDSNGKANIRIPIMHPSSAVIIKSQK